MANGDALTTDMNTFIFSRRFEIGVSIAPKDELVFQNSDFEVATELVEGVSMHLLIQRPIALERCIFMPMDMDTSTRSIVMQQVTAGCSKHAFHSMW